MPLPLHAIKITTLCLHNDYKLTMVVTGMLFWLQQFEPWKHCGWNIPMELEETRLQGILQEQKEVVASLSIREEKICGILFTCCLTEEPEQLMEKLAI